MQSTADTQCTAPRKDGTMSWFQMFLKQESTSYAAGDVIFERGDPAHCMYVVAEGEVEIAFGGTRVDVFGPEAIFGEMALISKDPRSATARARTDCRLVEIAEKRFVYLVHESPHFALAVMSVLADRLRRHDPAP
jgi:CRP/FNR family cyclic AMP-dependent transcriptional regulator